MKKKILAILTIAVMLFASMGGLSAFAFVSLEECDKCFQATMNTLLDRDDVEGNSITAVRKPIYDLFLQHLGYVYEFELVEGKGYAIIICDEGNYVAQEVMPHSESPYSEVSEEEQCVFVNSMSYYKAVEGKICDIASGEEISAEEFDFLKENAVFYKNEQLRDPEYVTVEIYYSSYQMETYGMAFRTPRFCGSGLTSGCAAVAGGNLIGYFDRYYEDLIPNHVAGRYISEYYSYNLADTYVYQAINTLYEDMEGTVNGITESNFKSGLQLYCERKGLTCDFSSVMSLGKLNYNSVRSSMQNNKPVALLLNTYNICQIGMHETNNDHYLQYTNYFGNHVMVGFGYRVMVYNLPDGSINSYRFIYVATGWADPSDAYFNIEYSTNIVSAYGVNIH